MIYIIIVNYKTWKDTAHCLESLHQSTFRQWQAIVVDNDSQNDSLQNIFNALLASGQAGKPQLAMLHEEEPVENYSQQILLVQSSSNRGFAGANNLILRQLIHKDGFVWLLNPDMRTSQPFGEQLPNHSTSNKRFFFMEEPGFFRSSVSSEW